MKNNALGIWLLLGTLGFLLWISSQSRQLVPLQSPPKEISYSQFLKEIEEKQVKSVRIINNRQIKGERFKGGDEASFKCYIPYDDPELVRILKEKGISFSGGDDEGSWLVGLLYYLGSPLIFVLLLWLLIFRQVRGAGGKFLNFGQSRARLLSKERSKTTFEDVAGVEEAKEELKEIIEFLKDPQKFEKLGAKIPKGVLLVGLPGTGKTLLAKAVAGEADVPFLSISGSDFVEMFVGVGASRVRDLFNQAKRTSQTMKKGCIIFIDEIDAVGRRRGAAGLTGGHDEREQTLNQLLVETDGFNANEGVILLAATNRPDVLDPALLRPGRFDRHIVIDAPDILGREAILKVHAKGKPLKKEVVLKTLARRTSGFVGSDLANMINEAALLAARKGYKKIGTKEFEEAIDRVVAGPERRSRLISPHEKKIIAYHECGHALVANLIPDVDPIHKISIMPRGVAALGYTLQLPTEDRYLRTRTEIFNKMIVLMGGRVTEEAIFNEVTTGAQNDIQRATEIAHKMVCEYGMSKELGPLTFGRVNEEMFLGRDIFASERNFSEEVASKIDREVYAIVQEAVNRAKKIIEENYDKLDRLATALIEKEVLEGEEISKIIGNVKS